MTEAIEDILALIVSDEAALLPSDRGILFSIDRQVKKGVALTDRQVALVKAKLLTYRNFFTSAGIENLDEALNSTKYPLRSVDRSKTITVEDGSIVIKFPFNKKNIVALQSVVAHCKTFYSHQSGSNVHKFKLNEKTVDLVLGEFRNKNFYIDDTLTEFYNNVAKVKMNPESVLPGIYKNELKNFKQPAIDFIKSELDTVTEENLIKFYDRRRRYGIASISCDNPGNLVGHIAFRDELEVAVDPASYALNDIVAALLELDRFPLLVLVDQDKSLDQVSTVYNAFSDVVAAKQQTVLFRDDNRGDYNLNNFIHERNLNNWLDKSTRIVYISKNKLPKLLLRSDWKPLATLAISSYRSNTNVMTYVKDVCDLIIYHDKDMSIIGSKNRYGTYY